MKYFLLFFMGCMVSVVSAQELDSAAIKKVDSLIEISRTFRLNRDFDKAFEFVEQAENACVLTLGKESESYGSCYFNKGLINFDKQDLAEAEKYFLLGKALIEKIQGKENSSYANFLKNLSNVYYDLGKYEQSEILNIEELEVREKLVGKQHAEYISCLNNLASIYGTMGLFSKAEPLNIEALSLCEKYLGKDHSEYVNSLNNLAILYFEMANYEKAEPLFIEAMAIREKLYGIDHPEYSASLNNLAQLYETMGNYAAAEALFLQSIELNKRILGSEHPDYVMSLQNLGSLYWHLGYYEKAETYNLEAKDIIEKTLGKGHPDYAYSLNNLATLYQALGNFSKAEPFFLEALSVREKIFGKVNRDYAFTLNSLATLYRDMGKIEKAEEIYSEVLRTMEKTVGKQHPDYALGLLNLADVYTDSKRFGLAEQLYNEANEVNRKILGKDHPGYALGLNNLANLYLNMGQYDKSEKIFLTVIDIQKKSLGKEHPQYAQSLNNLANVYELQNRSAESDLILEELYSIINLNLKKSVSFLSEAELGNYMTSKNDSEILSAYLQNRHVKNSPEGRLPSLIYDQALFQKGFILNAAITLKTRIKSNPEAEEANNRLKGYRRRLAKEYTLPLAERDSAEVAMLEENANAEEKIIARAVAGFEEVNRQFKWKDIRVLLDQKPAIENKEAVIEFVNFQVNFPTTTDSNLYAAIILYKDIDQPKFISLFEEKELDEILRQGENILAKTNSLYATRGTNPILKENTLSKNLYKLIWEPLENELKDVNTIYFSPSGRLSQLNIGAIPVDNKQVLSDKYRLIQLGSTRQLLDQQKAAFTNQTAAIFGGIKYDLNPVEINQINPKFESKGTDFSGAELSFAMTDSTLRGGEWNYLPGTENEIEVVEKTLQSGNISTRTYRNYQATEEVFKEIGSKNSASPRILHIATHGYFFPNPRTQKSPDNGTEDDPIFKISDNPLIRSGLILSGGAASWKTGKPYQNGMEDGILTAYEISQMNLSNTELVVLSACETGLGDIQGNEGVYGLQRAFKIAGAKYLIMSLWQVPDKQTSMLMTTFYRKWLEDKLSIPQAFHAAQKELREMGFDPYQWAGFVLVE